MLLLFLSLIVVVFNSSLEKTLLEDCDIELASEMTLSDPIDYALKYFILRRFQDNDEKANILLLSAEAGTTFTDLLVARSPFFSKFKKLSPKVKNEFISKICGEVKSQYLANRFRFKELSNIKNSKEFTGVDDVIINIWSLDPILLAKFYFFIDFRMIKPHEVLKELIYLSNKGEVNASGILGNMYLYGLGVAKDHEKAIEYFRLGSNSENAYCLTGIARCLMERSDASKKEIKEALNHSILKTNDPEANYLLFTIMNEESPMIPVENIHLKTAALSGYLPAVYDYGVYYASVHNYTSSNHSLLSVTQYCLEILDLDTKAFEYYIKKDYKKSVMYYLFLYEFGLKSCGENAIIILEKYAPLPRSKEILFSIYCDLAKENQMYFKEVGDCFYYGRGVEQSYIDAFVNYLKAKQNGGESIYSLATMYENGYGIPQNRKEAISLINSFLVDESAYLVRRYALLRILIRDIFEIRLFTATFFSLITIIISVIVFGV